VVEILLEKGLFSPKNELDLLFGDTHNQLTLTMNRLFLILAFAIIGVVATPSTATAEQYASTPARPQVSPLSEGQKLLLALPQFLSQAQYLQSCT